jgi:hypothetical protein
MSPLQSSQKRFLRKKQGKSLPTESMVVCCNHFPASVTHLAAVHVTEYFGNEASSTTFYTTVLTRTPLVASTELVDAGGYCTGRTCSLISSIMYNYNCNAAWSHLIMSRDHDHDWELWYKQQQAYLAADFSTLGRQEGIKNLRGQLVFRIIIYDQFGRYNYNIMYMCAAQAVG